MYRLLPLIATCALLASCGQLKTQNQTQQQNPGPEDIYLVQNSDLEGAPASLAGDYEGQCSFVDSAGPRLANGFLRIRVAQTQTTVRIDYSCSPTSDREATADVRMGSSGDLTIENNFLSGPQVVVGQFGRSGLTLTSRRHILESNMRLVVREGRVRFQVVATLNGQTLQTLTGEAPLPSPHIE